MIDWKDQKNRPITTELGERVEILGERDGKLIGLCYTRDGKDWSVEIWDLDGQHVCGPSVLDLTQAPLKIKRVLYSNVDAFLSIDQHATAALAKNASGGDDIATAIHTFITVEGDKVIIHGEGKVNNEGEKV